MTHTLKSILSDDFLNKCRDITERYEKLKGRWTPEAQILHIHSEIEEFNRALRKEPDNVLEEYADIILTTLATGNYFKFTNEQIKQCLISKLSIVENRLKNEEKLH